jgi:gluconolactonase
MELLSSDLAFPEGPVSLPDGTVLVGEEGRGQVTRVATDGSKTVVAETGGAPNGLALGPDGDLYICNNGGLALSLADGKWRPTGLAADHRGGWIQRVELSTGAVEVVADMANGRRLGAPNDLVFDAAGLCWFTDTLRGCVFVLNPSNGDVREAVGGLNLPNGIGFSPDGSRLYVSETYTGNLLTALVADCAPTTLWSSQGTHGLDSMAVDAGGNVCVASLGDASGISVVTPGGELDRVVQVPDRDEYVTNICFAADRSDRAYITSSGLGRLYVTPWRWS